MVSCTARLLIYFPIQRSHEHNEPLSYILLHSSGTEEYDKLTQLLEDIHTCRRDVLTILDKDKEEKKKEMEDKKQAEEMRTAAMETLSRKCTSM